MNTRTHIGICMALALTLSACSLTMSGDPRERREAAEAIMNEAVASMKAGEPLPVVADTMRSAVETDPDWAVGRAAYGNALFRMGDLEKAGAHLAWAVSLAPADPEYKFALGSLRLEQGRLSEAVGFLGEANRLRPDNRRYMAALLLAYIQVGRWDRAIQLWGAGAMEGADEADRIAVGIVLKAILDRQDEAAWDVQQAQGKYPEEPVYPFLEGLILEGQGRTEDAIFAYEKAEKLMPHSFDIRRVLLNLYLANGHYRKAERMTREVLKNRAIVRSMSLEERIRALYDMADSQYQTAKYRLSSRSYGQYRSILQRSKSKLGDRLQLKTLQVDSMAHFANGIIEERQKQYSSAISEYALAITGDPSFLLAYEGLGRSYLLLAELSDLRERKKPLSKAKEILEQALELKRDNPKVYMLLGSATYQLALLEKGQFRQGLLREALFLFGQADVGLRDKYAVRVFQGKISDTLGEYQQALKYYKDAAAARPKIAEVEMLVGHTNIKLQQYNDAINAFRAAMHLGGDGRDASLGIALAYEKLVLPEEADNWYDRADAYARQQNPLSISDDTATAGIEQQVKEEQISVDTIPDAAALDQAGNEVPETESAQDMEEAPAQAPQPATDPADL